MQDRKIGFRAATVATFLALVAATAPACAQTVAEGLSAYRNNRVAEAERIFTQVAAASTADRTAALRELGRIDGLVRGETDAIAAAMTQTPSGEEMCKTAAIALRVYRDAGEPVTPLAYAEAAASGCSPDDAQTLRIEMARTYLARAAADIGARTEHLEDAAAQLDSIDEAARGAPDVAGARFSLAMLRRDAQSAFIAWRDYYWLTDADAPQALGAYAGRVQSIFAAGLASNVDDADAIALSALLSRAGFTADARQYSADLNLASRIAGNTDWRRIDSFFAFSSAIRTITLRANREIATGGAAAWYSDEIRAAIGQLMQRNSLSGDPAIVLAETFGVYGSLGETSGYPSLHSGHLVQRERLPVSQYGRNGEVEFIVIDHMLSNGYESWLWDGWAEAGGWSSGGATIVQVRSAYTDGPLSALRRARPGPQRDRFLATIAREEADELSALGRDGVAPLPATESRLLLQVWTQIAERCADDTAFIAEIWRAANQSSIETHEGRHALDNVHEPGLSGAQLEFRAKLSQIIFADYPRLGLASVAGGVINDTAHGIGNRRVLEGYRRWMRRHRGEIVGFNRRAPTLTQLHLLTDDQIRAAAISLDPWAR